MIELLEWQKPFAAAKDAMLKQYGICVDSSDTGSGKTYTTVDVLKRNGYRALVIAPVKAIAGWKRVSNAMGATECILDVVNIEKLRAGNTKWYADGKWTLPTDDKFVVVLDEAHRGCCGPETQTTRMIALLKAYKVKFIPMSATIADSPLKMRALGYHLDFHQFNKASFYNWCRNNGCFKNPWGRGYALSFPTGPKAKNYMEQIHRAMKNRMVRATIADIPDFPDCETQANLYSLADRDRIELEKVTAELDERLKSERENVLAETQRLRELAETFKVPILEELCEDFLEEGKSVVVFLNYRKPLKLLQEHLEKKDVKVSVVHADSNPEDVVKFQANENHVCLVIAAAGGFALSLHDELKQRPRVSLITPSYNSTEVRQCLGRIWRCHGTKALQIFVLLADTIEEKVHKRLTAKLKNLDALLDGDLNPFSS